MAPLLAAALVAACGGDDEAAPPAPPPVTATIGAAGGTVNGPNGVQLVIPAGALQQDTAIRMARSDAGAPALPGEYRAAGPMIEITPHDLAFERPVTLRVPVTGSADAAVADVLVASPTEAWSPAQATVTGGVAEFTRLSLSWYQPWVCIVPVPNPDPYPCVFVRANSVLATVPAGGALARTQAEPTQSQWTLGEATTLRITTTYSGAADCLNPRLVVTRRSSGSAAPVVLHDQAVPMAPLTTQRRGGTVSHDLVVTAADNPGFSLGTAFSCNRPGRGVQRDGYAHSVRVAIAPRAAAPAITQPPADVTVAAGQAASFTVAATAPDTLSIAWQQSTDGGQTFTPLQATGSTLTLPTTAAGDNGRRYRARVCNSAAGRSDHCIDSAAALLTVNTPPPPAAVWTAPAAIVSGFVDDGAAGVAGRQRALAVWTAASPNGTRVLASLGSTSTAWAAGSPIDGGLAGGSSSYEPQLGMAASGQATAVWGVFFGGSYSVAANRFDGTAWGTAEELLSGGAADHRVAVDGSGRAVAVMQVASGSRYVIQLRIHAGGGWDSAQTLDRGGSATQPQVAVNAQGRGFVSYIEAGALVAAPLDLAAGTVGSPVVVATARSLADHRLAVDAAGGAVVAWIEDMVTGGYDLRSSRFVSGAWSAVETLAVNVGFERDLSAAAGAAGTAVVAWVASDAGGRNAVFARRHAPGGGWEASSRRSNAGALRVRAVQAAMNASGRIVLAWTQQDVGNVHLQAWAQVHDGAWGPAQAVQTATDDLQVPRLPLVTRSLALADDGTALLLWRESGAATTLRGAQLP